MNNVILIGRLIKDVELRYTQSSNATYARFTIAVDRQMSKDKKQEAEANGQQTADFINIVVWGKQAENCQRYLQKGRNVAIQGSIHTGSYVGDDGQRKYTFDITAEKVQFIDWGDKEKETDSFDDWDVGISEARDEEIPF